MGIHNVYEIHSFPYENQQLHRRDMIFCRAISAISTSLMIGLVCGATGGDERKSYASVDTRFLRRSYVGVRNMQNRGESQSITITSGSCPLPEKEILESGSVCENRKKRGYNDAKAFFESNFDSCDCDSVNEFTIQAETELLGNRCSRNGVQDFIDDTALVCNLATCKDVGILLSDLIIKDFCEIPSVRVTPSPYYLESKDFEKCEKKANEICEEQLFKSLVKLLKDESECTPVSDFDAMRAREHIISKLSKKCKEEVQHFLLQDTEEKKERGKI